MTCNGKQYSYTKKLSLRLEFVNGLRLHTCRSVERQARDFRRSDILLSAAIHEGSEQMRFSHINSQISTLQQGVFVKMSQTGPKCKFQHNSRKILFSPTYPTTYLTGRLTITGKSTDVVVHKTKWQVKLMKMCSLAKFLQAYLVKSKYAKIIALWWSWHYHA